MIVMKSVIIIKQGPLLSVLVMDNEQQEGWSWLMEEQHCMQCCHLAYLQNSKKVKFGKVITMVTNNIKR